jgi:uncharacterized protein
MRSSRLLMVPQPAQGIAARGEVFSIPLGDDRYILYAPLQGTALLANGALVNVAARLAGDASSAPAEDPAVVAFLKHVGIVGAERTYPPPAQPNVAPRPTTVTLFLTTACNLRCTYCYASAGDTPLAKMELPVAERGIAFVVANAVQLGEPTVTVNYHGGGEPTANWAVMTQSYRFARRLAAEHDLTVRAHTATNGLLSREKAHWISTNLDAAMVSYDGPGPQDVHRPTVSGRPSSGRVEQTLLTFDEAGFHYGIRMTVTRDQIEQLPDSVGHILRRFRPQRLHVEPAYPIGRWRNAPSAETTEFIAAFRKADQVARTFGRELFYSGARVGQVSRHFCGVTRDNFSLSPTGNVTACFEAFSESTPNASVFFYGAPETGSRGFRFNLPVLNALRAQTVDNREFCSGCFAKWNCAGDCYHRSVSDNGPGPFAGSDRCHVTRELTKDQLLRKIEEGGGIVWHDPTTRQPER